MNLAIERVYKKYLKGEWAYLSIITTPYGFHISFTRFDYPYRAFRDSIKI
mgnify:CR=1 FL=1